MNVTWLQRFNLKIKNGYKVSSRSIVHFQPYGRGREQPKQANNVTLSVLIRKLYCASSGGETAANNVAALLVSPFLNENDVVVKVQASDVLVVVAGNVAGLAKLSVVQAVHELFEETHAGGCG